MTNGEYVGAGAGVTKLLLHLNNDANDSSGNGNNGTVSGATVVDGKFGQCYSFDGVNDYIDCNGGVFGNNFTDVIWFKRGTPSGEDMIVTRWVPAGQNRWGVGFVSSSTNLSCMIGSDDTWRTISATDTEWHCVIITYGGTTAKAYYDGSQKLSFATAYTEENTNINIGRFNTNAGYYLGLADEHFFEARTWTPQEVAKYYSYAKGRYATL